MIYEQSGDGQIVHRTVPHQRHQFAPKQVVVRFAADAVEPHLERARLRESFDAFPEGVSETLRGFRAARPKSLVALGASPTGSSEDTSERGVVRTLAHSVTESDVLSRTLVVNLRESQDAVAEARQLARAPGVELAEVFPPRWLAAASKPRVRLRRLAADDPERNVQWSLRAVDWFAAARPPARDVIVAILDTGVDESHPSLAGRVVAYDTGGFGRTDIVGHGTHVAGVIAAKPRNDIPMTGMSDCRLKVWKVFPDKPDHGEFYVDAEVYLRALRAVEQSGATVVNLSLGGTDHSAVEGLLFRRLTERGITVVAAMGNEFDDDNPTEYPAAYPGVIGVGAIAPTLRRADFSNTGKHLAVMAPGVGVLSTVPVRRSKFRDEIDVASWDGTSMATPHVAAAVALYQAAKSEFVVDVIRERLCRTASPLPEMRARKRTDACGSGLLNVNRLLRAARR